MNYKPILTFLLFGCLYLGATAQTYQTSVGLRLGSPTSLSLKHFLSETMAVEAYAGTRSYLSVIRWYNLSAALLYHQPLEIIDLDNLHWYAGGGASAYFWVYDIGYGNLGLSNTTFGIQGYLGLDYGFEDYPINVSLDWIPSVFLGEGYIGGFGGGYGSLAIRYVL